MAKNISTEKKTLKEELATASNDIWCADRFMLYGNYLDKIILPDGNILDGFYDYFSNFLEEVELPERFYYQPAAFSENYYGTPDLDFLVLYFSQIPTLFEFNKKKIKVLPVTKLNELNQIAINYKLKVKNSYENPIKYTEIEAVTINKKKSYL